MTHAMKLNIYIVAALLALSGCNKKSESTDQAMTGHDAHSPEHKMGDPRTKDLMAIHDSIMPAMGTLMDLKQKIAVEIKTTDSLLAIQSTAVLKKRKEDALKLNSELEKADHEMMGWMHQYKADTLEKLAGKDADKYISDQTEKIVQVRDLMKQSLADARNFIQKK